MMVNSQRVKMASRLKFPGLAAAVTMVAALCQVAAADAAHGVMMEIAPLAASSLEARFPASVPKRAELVSNAKSSWCFIASDKIEFLMVARSAETVAEDSLKLEVRVENLFGEPPARTESTVRKTPSQAPENGVRKTEWIFSLEDNPGCGVWRIAARLTSPDMPLAVDRSAIFEVYSDETNGPSPTAASKLPVLVSVPHDEVDAKFDVAGFKPYGAGGFGQMFSASAARPSTAAKLRIWTAVAPFMRRFFCCAGDAADVRDERKEVRNRH